MHRSGVRLWNRLGSLVSSAVGSLADSCFESFGSELWPVSSEPRQTDFLQKFLML